MRAQWNVLFDGYTMNILRWTSQQSRSLSIARMAINGKLRKKFSMTESRQGTCSNRALKNPRHRDFLTAALLPRMG
jgi:hypothetical protein